MSTFKKNLKDNVIVPYNRYNISQEKIAEIIETHPLKRTCTICYKNIDGIQVIKQNIKIKKGFLASMLGGFPKKGDFLEIEETGQTIRVLGVADTNNISESEKKTKDNYSGPSNFSGFSGI